MRRTRATFTLIKLLVVVAITATLIAIPPTAGSAHPGTLLAASLRINELPARAPSCQLPA